MNANRNEAASVRTALVGEFESLFYARADMLREPTVPGSHAKEDASALHIPFADLLHALESLRNGASSTIIAASRWVLVGAGDFASPTGPPPSLGRVKGRFCYVLELKSYDAGDLQRYFEKTSPGGLVSPDIWQWVAARQEGDESPEAIYASRVTPAYLLVSNDIDTLKAIRAKLQTRAEEVRDVNGPPPNVVDQHGVWGFRRRMPAAFSGDETILHMPQGIESILVLVDASAKSVLLRVRSSSPTEGVAPRISARLPPLRRTAPGEWEAVVSLAGDEESLERILTLMGVLGFGVFL